MDALNKTAAFVSEHPKEEVKNTLDQLLMFRFMNGSPGYSILQSNRNYVELINSVLVETATFPRIQVALGKELKLTKEYGIGR